MKQCVFELKSHRKSFFFWLLGLSIFMVLIMMEFSAYRNNPELLEILDVMPVELLEAFGLLGANLTTISGFVSITLVYLQLMLAIYAAMLGVTILSKESKWKTVDFLYVMPRSRRHIVTVKFVSGLMLISLMLLSVVAIFALIALRYDPEPSFWSYLWRSHGSMYLILLMFYGFGFALSAILKRSNVASAIAAISAFFFYLLSVLINLVESLEWLEPISVFSYVSFSELIESRGWPISTMMISLGFVCFCFGLSILIYPKVDLGVSR